MHKKSNEGVRKLREFDKIYIAKYYDLIEKWQILREFNLKEDELENIVKDLRQIGIYEVYKNMSDEEWEMLEKKSDLYILRTYLPKIPGYYLKIFNKIVANFKEDLETTYKYQFEIYNQKKNTFNFDYFKEGNFDDEEWKRIGKMNYEISNYGRIKNIQTKKLKALKRQRFGMQVILWQSSKSYTITISRLVATMFIRKVEADERVSHINGNIRDNYYKNLKIVSK